MDFSETFFNTLPPGGLFLDEAELLWRWAKQTTGDMLEVGSAYGRSACLLGTIAKEDKRNLICVDPWEGSYGENLYREFLKNTEGLPISIKRMKVEDWEPQPVGFAYLDGDHSFEGTKAQIEKALLCKPSVIAIHDFAEKGGGLVVQAATLEILGEPYERADRMVIYKLK